MTICCFLQVLLIKIKSKQSSHADSPVLQEGSFPVGGVEDRPLGQAGALLRSLLVCMATSGFHSDTIHSTEVQERRESTRS